MELRHLRYFKAVAETLNFSEAARRLHIAQPPLSRQIRDLEQELGVQLFTRAGRRVSLTEAGVFLQGEVALMFQRLDSTVAGVRRAGCVEDSELNIGADWRLPMNRLAEAVNELRRQRPDARINFVDLPASEQIEALHRGRLHVAFMPDLFLGTRTGLELLRVERPEVLAALPPTHPFARRSSLRLSELRNETWVILNAEVAPGFRKTLLRILKTAGVRPRALVTAPSIDAMVTLTAAGAGVCLMIAPLIRPQYSALRFVPTDSPPFDLSLLWRNGQVPGLAREFIAILRARLTET